MRLFPSFSRSLVVAAHLTLCFTASIPLAAQEPSGKTPSGAPVEMYLCVDTSCETLIWRGSYYDGIKDQGSVIATHYTVERWTKEGIRIDSKSVTPLSINNGPRIGGFPITSKTYLEGIFTGPISADGQSIENGKVSWKFGKQSSEMVFKLTWKADSSAKTLDSSNLPAVAPCSSSSASLATPHAMLVCDGLCLLKSNKDVSEWVFNGNTGIATWTSGMKAKLTIQEWSNGNLRILREDTPDSTTAGVTAEYRGNICGDTIKGTTTSHWPGHWDSVTVSWTANIPVTSCDKVGDDTRMLLDTAQKAIEFRLPSSAFKCLSRAAGLGDMNARTATAMMYRDGIGTNVSYPDALRLLKQSAIQGDYNAQKALQQVYDIGVGVARDPAEAEHWNQIAFNNPASVQEREARRQAGQAQQFMFLGLTALVEAMATPSVYVVHESPF